MRRFRALTASLLTLAVALSLMTAESLASASASAHGRTTVIKVWLADYPFPGYLDQRLQLAEEFNRKYPSYQVEIEAVYHTELPAEVYRAVQEGNPPDVANYYYNATQIARDMRAKNGKPLFVSVERAIGNRKKILDEKVVLKDLVPHFASYYEYRGDMMSMPVTAMTSLVYANTTVLAAAGVSQVPRTWQELERACAAIAALPDGPQHCVTWPNHNWFFQQAVAQQGGYLTNNGNGRYARATRTNLLSREMLEYVTWWQRMHEAGYYQYSGVPEDWGSSFEAFVGQQVAFTFDSANQGDTFVEFGRQSGFEVAAGELPYNGRARRHGNLNSGDSLFLRAGLDRRTQDGALAFMQFINSPENSAGWHQSSSYLPMNRKSVDLLERAGWFADHPAPGVALDQIAASRNSPAGLGTVTGAFDAIQNEMVVAMDDVLVRNANPWWRFKQADANAQRLLNTYNRECVGPGLRDAECFRVGMWG